jgi:hypothetical protein
MESKTFGEIARYDASGRERLGELATFLEDLPADRLTFTRWYGEGKGCAVGLAAALNPWFQAQGLRLAQDQTGKICWPVYGGQSDRAAVADFFGLSQPELRALLDPEGYGGMLDPHPKSVARKIRTFLAEAVEAA